MSTSARHLFGEVIAEDPVRVDRAVLLIAAQAEPVERPERVVQEGRDALDRLADAVPGHGRDDERLRAALGEWRGSPGAYERLASSMLPQVLRSRTGLPILLSIAWVEVAARAGIPAYGVALPGHFVACVGDPETFREDAIDGGRVLVDPWRGGTLLPYDRARDIVEATGGVFRRAMLAPAPPLDTIARVLANIRMWAQHPLRASTRLWAIDFALMLPDPPAMLLRDRGLALVDLGHIPLGARWLEEYADLVEEREPAEAEAARTAAEHVRARLN